MKIFVKDKRLGSARDKRRYDLPLDRDESSGALTLLLALMTFMAAMTLAGSFAVGSMASRWSSGLENKMTVEIPAEDSSGKIISEVQMTRLQQQAVKSLYSNSHVKKAESLGKDDVQALVEPWLGKNMPLDDIPLPALISVETDSSAPEVIDALRASLEQVSPAIELDTHESWLTDLLRLTRSLHFAALIVALIIGAATASAIAGAIRARIAVYRGDVELLHFMGASDHYIMRQFQRHAMGLSLKGSIIGVVGGVTVLGIIAMIAGDMSGSVLPALQLNLYQGLFIAALPLVACLIGALTARVTVMRVLSLMP